MTTCIRLSPHPPTRAPSSPILYSFTPTSAHPRPLPARFARPQHPPPRHGAPFVRGSSGYARCGAAIPSPGARKRPRRTPEDGLQPNGLQWTRIYIYISVCSHPFSSIGSSKPHHQRSDAATGRERSASSSLAKN